MKSESSARAVRPTRMKTLRGPKKMVAKRRSPCGSCPRTIEIGATIYWSKATGALCHTCGQAHYARSVGAMHSANEQARLVRAWESMTPAQREALRVAREAARADAQAKLDAERAITRAAAWEAEKAERAAHVRKNLTAWLADRSSKPASQHAWLEKQCRILGLLPSEGA